MSNGHEAKNFKSVHLAVRPGVSAKTVHAALDRIFEIAGCPACGFNGILDLKVNVIHPEVSGKFDGLLGVSENLGKF